MSNYSWTEPKTNWNAGNGGTPYNGDRFTYRDFNRIKNNVMYLYDLATQIYPINAQIANFIANSEAYRQGGGDASIYHYFFLYDDYADRDIEDFVYADEINFFEERLDFLKEIVQVTVEGTMHSYTDNGRFIHANQLNYLEKLSLALKESMYPLFIARRKFAFTLSQATNHMDL